jgi:tRNA (guanine-N7-)-methyltransferase
MRLFRPDALSPPRDFVPPTLPTDRPLWLEIGAGVGLHALTCARQHPDIDLIAIERTAEKFQKFQQSFVSDPRPNLTPIHADALPWVVHALPPASVSQLFILYPNPEPKNPAQRWLNMPFFAFLLSRLQANAQIVLASNIVSYVDEAEQQARQVWQLPVTRHEVNAEQVGAGRTHFEIKYLARGEPCAELRMVKPLGYCTPFDAASADQ